MVLGKIEAILNDRELRGEEVVLGGIAWFMKVGRIDGTGTEFDGTEVACMQQQNTAAAGEKLFSARLEVTYGAYPVVTYGYSELAGHSLTTPTGIPEYVPVGSRHHFLNCYVLDKTVFQRADEAGQPREAVVLQLPVMAQYGPLDRAA
jgi:hypothetical protein